MELTTPQIFIAIVIFIVISLVLVRITYIHYKQESGARFWNTKGGKTNYLRLLVLLSMGITVTIMFIITGLFSIGK